MLEFTETKLKLSLSNFRGKCLQCPNCGKLRLKPYAYADGRIESEKLGRCQREVNCGYHLKPSEYFRDKGESFSNTKTFSEYRQKKMFALEKSFIDKYISGVENSTLLQFMQMTGIDYLPVFKNYLIGATRSGATVFPQFDGVSFRTAKVIKYLENGHRDKSVRPPVFWLHKKVDSFDEQEYEIRQCFFGRHLLDDSNVICIVESEKTALLCAGLFPGAVWMATGGRTQLSGFGISELSRKKVLLFPDSDSVVYWREKTRTFGNCEIIDLSKFNAEKKEGADVADYFLEGSSETRSELYLKISGLIKSRLY